VYNETHDAAQGGVATKESSMNTHRITSKAGVDLGIYEGEIREDAFLAMVIDAGYSPEDIGEWPVGGPDDWIIEEVSEYQAA
jgi:hypothetical protein